MITTTSVSCLGQIRRECGPTQPRELLAGVHIAQHSGRPHPHDQAWIQTLFEHVKGEWPHPAKITTPVTTRPRATGTSLPRVTEGNQLDR